MYVFIWILTGAAGAMAMIGAAHWIARAKPRAVSHTPLVAHAKQSLETQVARLGELERWIISHVVQREAVARDTNIEFEGRLTLGERMADPVSGFGGSWTFLAIFAPRCSRGSATTSSDRGASIRLRSSC